MGKVFLVGSGPGDPELLTVKAVRLLKTADVVLHDALVSDAILAEVRPEATLVNIGKRCRQKLLTQDEINAVLVSYASSHNVVIRLKGGDPSIFGRAGEEIEALIGAGIDYEIVPGITAACASAAAAGVSLTDRRFASSVVFTTAHRRTGPEEVAWNKLVTSDSTLVIYMPGQDYATLRTSLRAAGLPNDMPCTVVSAAGRERQQVLRTSIGSLPGVAALPAPALLIVGECASALFRQTDRLEQWLELNEDLKPVRVSD